MLLAGMMNWLGRSSPPDVCRAAAGAAGSPDPPAPEEVGEWPAARIALAGRLWGDGFVLPGGEQETLHLARPLGLSEASSLLLLGCGPGGAARSIAAELGVWVSGFEADADLAAAGATHCAKAGLGRRAQIGVWTPETPDFPRRYFHHALGLEAMRAASVENALAAVALALRPAGQVTLLELVAAEPGEAADLARWMELERRAAPPPSQAAVTRALGRLGFDIRVAEDVSQRHVLQAVRGWGGALAALRDTRPDAVTAAVLVREAELWLLRVRLLRGGCLRLVRWHAIARGGGPRT